MSTSNLQQFLANTTANLQHLLHRAEAQIEFAQTLCELHPDQAPAWQPAIDQARQLLSQSLAAGHLDNMAPAVAHVERTLSPLAKTAKSYTAHCVGHAHIDMNWMWSWPETVGVTVDTFTTVLRLMDEFPDFRFTQSQASVYEIVRSGTPRTSSTGSRRGWRRDDGRWRRASGSRGTRTSPRARRSPGTCSTPGGS